MNKRYPPLEQFEIPLKLLKVEERLNTINHDEKVSIENVDFSKNAKAKKILKENIYNWQPINFDKLTCLTYLVSRSVQNYAVSCKIFNEIKLRDKNFKPQTLLDFGSGVGTVMW